MTPAATAVADQLAAAAAETSSRAMRIATAEGWDVTTEPGPAVTEVFRRWDEAPLRICGHVAGRPQPLYADAAAPGVVVCSTCSEALAERVAEARGHWTCSGCGVRMESEPHQICAVRGALTTFLRLGPCCGGC